MKRTFLFFLSLAACILTAAAQDFTALIGGNLLRFEVTAGDSTAVAVTYPRNRNLYDIHASYNAVKGRLVLPATVNHQGRTYTVRAIGTKAFYGEKALNEIVLPSTVEKIADFAFEGCEALSSVVFPAKMPEIGSGAFFRCTSLASLSFGSDWLRLDISPYRWSRELKTIYIPAHVSRVINLKSVASLESVTVDTNNDRFLSIDGALYDRTGRTLYGVPRAKDGTLCLPPTATHVAEGALSDCRLLTAVDFPASLEYVSFRDLEGLVSAETLTFRGINPPVTAYQECKGLLLVPTLSKNMKIVIAREAKTAYSEALVSADGEYTVSQEKDAMPYKVSSDGLVGKKQLKTVKTFTPYE